MARTIEQIQNEILKAKEAEASLNGLNSTSKVEALGIHHNLCNLDFGKNL